MFNEKKKETREECIEDREGLFADDIYFNYIKGPGLKNTK